MAPSPPMPNDAAGSAALAICESLLVALADLSLISERDACDILEDVATTHREAAASSQSPQLNNAIVVIIERILAGKNSQPH